MANSAIVSHNQVPPHPAVENGEPFTQVFIPQLIIAVLKDSDGIAPAQPYQADILAEDWEIID